jgi:hypothetical protein
MLASPCPGRRGARSWPASAPTSSAPTPPSPSCASAPACAAAGARPGSSLSPSLAIALAERGNGNEDGVLVPVWAGVDLSPVRVWLETGLDSDIEAFADEVRLRFGVGAARDLGPVTLGLSLGFPQLFGPQNSGRLRQAALSLTWFR